MNDPEACTPIDRLVRLEQLTEELMQLGWAERHRRNQAPPSPPAWAGSAPHQALWQGSEQLLTLLHRRHPEALLAYEAPAEVLPGSRQEATRISRCDGPSSYRLVWLRGGDALIYPAFGHAAAIYASSGFQALFDISPHDLETVGVLVRPARARPIRSGQLWVLDGRGRMERSAVPMASPESLQAALEERLDSLERQMQRQQTRHQQEIQNLRESFLLQEQTLEALRQLVIHRPSGVSGPASGGSGARTDDTAG